jgi:diketogulonate reductase-like aldo/keto reductase
MLQAYSPLRHVDMADKRLTSVAAAHNASAAQVALRWITQQEVLVATSPGDNKKYAEEDLSIFDFDLTPTEMVALSEIKAAGY